MFDRCLLPSVSVVVVVGSLAPNAFSTAACGEDEVAPNTPGERAFLERVLLGGDGSTSGGQAVQRTEAMQRCIDDYLDNVVSPWASSWRQQREWLGRVDATARESRSGDSVFNFVLAARGQQNGLSPWDLQARMMLRAIAHDKEGASPFLRLAAAMRAAAYADEAREQAEASLTILTAVEECLTGDVWQPEEIRLAYAVLTVAFDAVKPAIHVERFLNQLAPGLDPWLLDMLWGDYHIRCAWEARGSGWAHEVTEEGWAGFYRHLGLASDHLLRAHDAAPHRPEAATGLITVAMGDLERPGGRDEQGWFEAAIAVQPTYAEAWSARFHSLLPRWGGSHDAILDVGRAALQIADYRTIVPYQFIDAVERIARDVVRTDEQRAAGERVPRNYEHLLDPGVYRLASEVLNRYIDEPSTPAAVVQTLRSKLLCFAWKHQDWETARRLVELLPRSAFDDTESGNFWISATAMYEDVLLHTSPAGPSVRRGDEAMKARDSEKAATLYSEALSAAASDEAVAALIRGRQRAATMAGALRSGGWVDAGFDDILGGWDLVSGVAEATADGGLRFPPSLVVQNSTVKTRFELGRRWELTWRFSLDAQSGRGSLVVYPCFLADVDGVDRASPVLYFQASSARSHQLKWANEREIRLAPIAGAASMRLVRWDDEIRFWINDALVVTGAISGDAGTELAFGRAYPTSSEESTISEVRLRVLSERPPD